MSNYLRESPTLTPTELFENIDWKLLKEQKHILLEMMDNSPIELHHVEAIEGVIMLINDLQDIAVDYYNKDENLIFDLNNEV